MKLLSTEFAEERFSVITQPLLAFAHIQALPKKYLTF